MTRILLFLLSLSLVLQSGCVYSYYTYSLDSGPRDWFRVADPYKFMSGKITVEYERHGIFPRHEGFLRLDPAHRLLTLITLPIALCVELPWQWYAKKQVCFAIRHPPMVDGLSPRFFAYPHTKSVDGKWRILSELRWTDQHGSLTRIVLADRYDDNNGWRNRLCICEASGRRDIDIPIVGLFVSGMATFDGNTIYLFKYFDWVNYFDHFWRIAGAAQDVLLAKFDMTSGEFTKMIWFDGGTIHVYDDVILDNSTLKTCRACSDASLTKTRRNRWETMCVGKS